MSYVPLKKGTLLVISGTYNNPNAKHLFIICTDICDKGCHVVVPLTTYVNNLCDDTCAIDRGEHAFVKHKSYILYRKAEIREAAALIAGVANRIMAPHDDMNGQTFLRIKNGLCRSIHTPRKVKKYIRCPAIKPIAPSSPSIAAKPDASERQKRS